MGVKCRLRGYIRDDRPVKLKSYVSSHDVDLDRVKLGHGRNVLHFCALFGSGDMLRCLLRLECDATRADKDGNLALHLALRRGLDGDYTAAQQVLCDLVTPLQQAYPLGQDVENRRGETAHDMLTELRDKVRRGKPAQEKRTSEPVGRSVEEDEMWRRKLADEFLFEAEEQGPRYTGDDDNYYTGYGAQSFDRWSEQIQEELYRKRQSQHQHTFLRDRRKKQRSPDEGASVSGGGVTSPNRKPGSQGGSSQHHGNHGNSKDAHHRNHGNSKDAHHRNHGNSREEELKRAREEMRKRYKPVASVKTPAGLLLKKQRYEKKFSQLLQRASLPGKSLTFACVPWPHVDVNSVAEVLFCDLPDKAGAAYRKYLRAQQVRWHPDKFTQKFGDDLHPDHKAKVMARVKAISQVLNRLESERVK